LLPYLPPECLNQSPTILSSLLGQSLIWISRKEFFYEIHASLGGPTRQFMKSREYFTNLIDAFFNPFHSLPSYQVCEIWRNLKMRVSRTSWSNQSLAAVRIAVACLIYSSRVSRTSLKKSDCHFRNMVSGLVTTMVTNAGNSHRRGVPWTE
jgi:hypothetical protein